MHGIRPIMPTIPQNRVLAPDPFSPLSLTGHTTSEEYDFQDLLEELWPTQWQTQGQASPCAESRSPRAKEPECPEAKRVKNRAAQHRFRTRAKLRAQANAEELEQLRKECAILNSDKASLQGDVRNLTTQVVGQNEALGAHKLAYDAALIQIYRLNEVRMRLETYSAELSAMINHNAPCHRAPEPDLPTPRLTDGQPSSELSLESLGTMGIYDDAELPDLPTFLPPMEPLPLMPQSLSDPTLRCNGPG